MASFVPYKSVVADATGDIVPAAEITVRRASDSSLATLYSDEGSTALTNPFNADATTAEFEFYTAPGRYVMTITKDTNNFSKTIDLVDGRQVQQFDGRTAAVDWVADTDAADGTVFSDGTVEYVISSGATAISDMLGVLPFGVPSPLHYAENTTPGTTNMAAAVSSMLGGIADPNFNVDSTVSHPDVRQKVSVTLSGDPSSMYSIKDVDNVRLSGVFDYNNATGFGVVVNGAVDGFMLQEIDMESDGFSVIVKPSTGTGGYAENGVIYGCNVRGGATTTDVGISIDGDTRNVSVHGNAVKNIQRSDGGTRFGHAFAVAGNEDDVPVNDATNLVFYGNVIDDIEGNAFHIEDDNPRVSFCFNVARDVLKGIEIVNDHVPRLQNYVGNAVAEATEYFIDSAGTGSSKLTNFGFNLFDGNGVSLTTSYAVRINQLATENINYIGNMHLGFNVDAMEITADGPMTIAYNAWDTMAADVLVGRSSTTDRAVLIESNNKFKDITGNIIDKTNSAAFIGDNVVLSDELDGGTAGEAIVFVAQRDGWLTGVTRVITSAGGGGSVNGAFTVSKITSGTPTTLITNSVPRTSTQYDTFLWGSNHAQILVNSFSKGDVIRVSSDGAGDASTLFRVQLDYFYYN